MAKEFNLDDYKYEEEHIPYDQWLHAYEPQQNHLNPDAKFDGRLYEHQGLEWDFIGRQINHHQWTLVRTEDGRLLIRNGLAVKGRLGYFFSQNMHNAHATIIVDGVPDLDF
jgi:hypothetical protein